MCKASGAHGRWFAFGDLLEYFHRLAAQVMGGIIMTVVAVMVDWFPGVGLPVSVSGIYAENLRRIYADISSVVLSGWLARNISAITSS